MDKFKVFKKSDIFTILIIAVAGTVASYYLANMILGDPSDASVTYKMIDEITATMAVPDPEIFNEDAINPTVEVYVGSCEDVDQNGILSAAELSACGEATVEEDEEEEENEGEEQQNKEEEQEEEERDDTE